METKVTRYQSYSGTIAAGDTFVINRQGRSVTCLSASDDLEIVIDDGSRSFFTAGISMEFDEPFAKVQLHNPTAGPVTFLIATAMGKVDDNRLTASGNVQVLDPGAGAESFSDVIASQAAILAMMQNADDQRTALSELGDSFATGVGINGVIAILDPVSNVNGVIVRKALVHGNTEPIAIYADTSAPSGHGDFSKRIIAYAMGANLTDVREDVALPAGLGLWVAASGVGCVYSLNYEVM